MESVLYFMYLVKAYLFIKINVCKFQLNKFYTILFMYNEYIYKVWLAKYFILIKISYAKLIAW